MSSTRIAMAVLMLAATNVTADTQIHRCLLEDGTFAFQEMPCTEPVEATDDGDEAGNDETNGSPRDSETPGAGDDVFDFVNPFDEPANPPTPIQATPPEVASEDRAECEKTTRDAIDAIDLEMRENAYTKEQGEEHLANLLALTRQLRACKRL